MSGLDLMLELARSAPPRGDPRDPVANRAHRERLMRGRRCVGCGDRIPLERLQRKGYLPRYCSLKCRQRILARAYRASRA